MSEEQYVDDIDLNEVKADGEDSMSADPVAPAGGSPKGKNRKADMHKSVDPSADEIEDDVKTPQGKEGAKAAPRMADKKAMKEAIEGIFEGSDLSEDFKQRTVAVFEAAVHEKVVAVQEELEAKFEQDLEEQVQFAVSDIVEKVDAYLDYVVESWMEENEIQIESGIKVEVAESLFAGLKSLAEEHNIQIDEEEIDVVSGLEAQLEETTEKYNEVFEELLEARQAKDALEREIVFKNIVEGLTDTQAEKLRVLSEGVSFDTVEEFGKKVEAIRDSYFTEAVAPVSEEDSDLLQEETEEEKPAYADPVIGAYVQSLSRFAAKK